MATKTKAKHKGFVAVTPHVVRIKPVFENFDFYFIALVLLILFIALLRFQLADVPLERDEGEYAYMGKLILEGIAPYKTAYNMKLPGTYFMYALLMAIFGKTAAGIHYGLLLVNSATTFFLFLAFRRMFNSSIAFFASGVYAIMSLGPAFLGFAAHATQFVTFFCAVAIYFLALFMAQKKSAHAFLAGVMFGLAFLMKQQAVFFMIFGGLMIIILSLSGKPIRYKSLFLQGAIYCIGSVLPYMITVLFLKLTGGFEKFWFWTVTYASKYASGLSLKDGMTNFKQSFQPMKEFSFFWLLFLAGIVVLFFSNYNWKQKLTSILFCLFAVLTVLPGFYFRQHYFICVLPAVGLMSGIALNYVAQQLAQFTKLRFLTVLPTAVYIVALLMIVAQKRDYYLNPDTETISRNVYGTNPFIESQVIADYINEHSNPQDKIAVLGSEPQIYFLSDRQSATGYIYTYALMEKQSYNKTMQQEMIKEIEGNKPQYLVFCNVQTSWLRRPDSPALIFDWFNKYVQNYVLVGVADISAFATVYKWNLEAATYKPQSDNNVYIFKRKT